MVKMASDDMALVCLHITRRRSAQILECGVRAKRRRRLQTPRNVLSLVDGHASFVNIYWDGLSDSDPCNYEPPAGYDYTWDGN